MNRPRKHSLGAALILALLSLAPSHVRGREGPPPVLNPKAYSSPSGEFELEVDPSTMHGQGEGTYRLMRQGKEVWSGKRPFTLWEAGVTLSRAQPWAKCCVTRRLSGLMSTSGK